jgi:hypothetical protein
MRGKFVLGRSTKAYRGRTGKSPRIIDSEGGHFHCAVAVASYFARTPPPPHPVVGAVITQLVSGFASRVDKALSWQLHSVRSDARSGKELVFKTQNVACQTEGLADVLTTNGARLCSAVMCVSRELLLGAEYDSSGRCVWSVVFQCPPVRKKYRLADNLVCVRATYAE